MLIYTKEIPTPSTAVFIICAIGTRWYSTCTSTPSLYIHTRCMDKYDNTWPYNCYSALLSPTSTGNTGTTVQVCRNRVLEQESDAKNAHQLLSKTRKYAIYSRTLTTLSNNQTDRLVEVLTHIIRAELETLRTENEVVYSLLHRSSSPQQPPREIYLRRLGSFLSS